MPNLQDAVMPLLRQDCVDASGLPLKGAPISNIQQELRYRGWKNVSHKEDLIDDLKKCGFKVIRKGACMRHYRGGRRAPGSPATIVTHPSIQEQCDDFQV